MGGRCATPPLLGDERMAEVVAAAEAAAAEAAAAVLAEEEGVDPQRA